MQYFTHAIRVKCWAVISFFASQMTVCRPAGLLQLNRGRSLWWLWEFFRFLLHVWRPLAALLDLLLVQPPCDFHTVDRRLDTFHVETLPEERLELSVSLRFLLDRHLSHWARMGGSAIVLYQSYWQEFRSTGLVSVFSLMSDHGKYPLN